MSSKSCNGCRHNHYSAPYGQAWDHRPHSYCRFLSARILMTVEQERGCDGQLHNRWVASEIPAACPVYAQLDLFPH